MTESAASDIAGKYENRINVCIQRYNKIIRSFWIVGCGMFLKLLCLQNAQNHLTIYIQNVLTLVSLTCKYEDICFTSN